MGVPVRGQNRIIFMTAGSGDARLSARRSTCSFGTAAPPGNRWNFVDKQLSGSLYPEPL